MGISLKSAIAQHKEVMAHGISMVRHIFINVLGEIAILISIPAPAHGLAHLFPHIQCSLPNFPFCEPSIFLLCSEAPDDQSQYKQLMLEGMLLGTRARHFMAVSVFHGIS